MESNPEHEVHLLWVQSIPMCYLLEPCVGHKDKSGIIYLGHHGIILKGFNIKHFVFWVAK